MIGRLNHVAIVVPDLDAATRVYRDTLGARVSDGDLGQKESRANARDRCENRIDLVFAVPHTTQRNRAPSQNATKNYRCTRVGKQCDCTGIADSSCLI